MSELEKQTDDTSKTARNLLYLAGLVVAGFVGGVVAGPLASSLVKAPDELGALQKQVADLTKEVERLSSLPYDQYVKIGDRLTLFTGDGRPLQTWSTNQVIVDSRPEIQRSGKTDWTIGKY